METLNLVGVILGIVASFGTIATLYFQHSKAKASELPSHRPKDKAVPSSNISPEPSVSRILLGPIGVSLRKGTSFFCGLLGAGALMEGYEFGETFLMALGIGFWFIAYRLWPTGLQLHQSER